MKTISYDSAKKLAHFCYVDFIIRLHVFKVSNISGVKFPYKFGYKLLLACNFSFYRYINGIL